MAKTTEQKAAALATATKVLGATGGALVGLSAGLNAGSVTSSVATTTTAPTTSNLGLGPNTILVLAGIGVVAFIAGGQRRRKK